MEITARVAAEGTPLIDGQGATFVWLGERAPYLVGDWNHWGDGAEEACGDSLTEVEPGVWTRTVEFPQDAYIEYAFCEGDVRLTDPYNLAQLSNGINAINHSFAMPAWRENALTTRKAGVPAGTLEQVMVPTGGLLATATRSVYLYRPPADGPVPLLVLFDGTDYLLPGRLPILVDNLIAERRMRPIAMAFVDNGREARMAEYLCSDATVAFLARQLLPLAAQKLPLLDIATTPGAFGVAGASLGGLMALYCALRAPQLFGHVISQSGGFAFKLAGSSNLIFDLVRQAQQRPKSLWMDVGRYEWLRQSNEHLRAVLAESGYHFAFRTYNGGHNFTWWRNEMALALPTVWGTE